MKDVFRVINGLVDAGVVETYAVGGAIGATFYIEPFLTFDLDIFVPIAIGNSGLISLAQLYEHLQSLGYHPNGDAVEIEEWHVQFLTPPNLLVDEAVLTARTLDVDGEPVRVMAPEYLITIALQTGRGKDFARVKMFKDLEIVDEKLLLSLIKKYGLETQWQKYKTLL